MATEPQLALVLTGGGARAAYQVGFLRHLASRYPNLSPGILTGVSAGGIIATHLASRTGDFAEVGGPAVRFVAQHPDGGCVSGEP